MEEQYEYRMEQRRKKRKAQKRKRNYINILLAAAAATAGIVGISHLCREEPPLAEAGKAAPYSQQIPVAYRASVPDREIPVVLQEPELPAGCEAAAAVMLLQAYGYEAGKVEFAQSMPQSTLEIKNGRTYAPHPNQAYIGNPFSSSGFGALSKVTAETMQKLIGKENGRHVAVDIAGSSEEEILNLINKGVPVCIWSTMSMLPLVDVGGWFLKNGDEYTEQYYIWPGNEHCMLLTAYSETSVTVHDPRKGRIEYERQLFFERYREVGCYAVILKEPV